MSVPFGKSALQRLAEFVVAGWYVTAIRDLVAKVIDSYNKRSEILEGGVISAGASVTASVLQVDLTAMRTMLKGRLMADIALQNDADLFTTAGAIGQPMRRKEDEDGRSGLHRR